jgi:hypothetical protein
MMIKYFSDNIIIDQTDRAGIRMGKGKNNELTLDYRKHPKARFPYQSFSERIETESDQMFWESACSFIMLEENSCPPAYWDFIIRTSDFWRCRPTSKNPAPYFLAQMPDFERILSCGYWNELFGIYEKPLRLRDVALPRRDKVQSDLVRLWQYATTDSNRSLPLAKTESVDEAQYILETASQELGVEGLVMAYAAGVPMEDVFAR